MGRNDTDSPAFSWKAWQEPVLGQDLSSNFSDYTVWAMAYRGGIPDNEQTDWLPIPELRPDDADVAFIAVIGHSVTFIEQVNDPIFSAHRPAGMKNVNPQWPDSRDMTYFSDHTDGIMACTMQHQICDPNKPPKTGCTPLTAAASLRSALNQTLSSELQRTYAKSILSLIIDAHVEVVDFIQMLGITALDARNAFYGPLSNPVPDNQWEKEVELWWQGTLAALQLLVTEQVTGPSMVEAQQLFSKPQTKEEKLRCKNQKIRSTAYTSFSTLGLAIIFSLGGTFIILSYTLEPCVAYIQRKRNLDVYHRLEWATNGTLQLQRLAHEELGLGTWTGAAKEVPVVVASATGGTKLAVVDVSNVDHPVLVAPPETLEVVMASGKVAGAETESSD
ncbi:hypothetical protein DIS24_g10716 [Lasiodiplodia hormozganensis]|uniref:Uncharacterized protein n=1 Tax=Lasiodiplodia hormozganensis TaxID=869390 RepID=A0AA39XP64_9PEZI|nr:hypothetical protein DIS24_g10716 [Lasiodiplodia hormozganensis]